MGLWNWRFGLLLLPEIESPDIESELEENLEKVIV